MSTPLLPLPPRRLAAPKLFRLSKTPGFNAWKNPLRITSRVAKHLLPKH